MKLHIYEAIKKYADCNPLRMHFPGNKGKTTLFECFADVTESDFSDNLQNPKGIIRSAERDVAKILGAERSFIVTDGATAGILAAVRSVKKLGAKIAVNRNSHKSVFNACELFGIEPVILPQILRKGLFMPPNPEDVEKTLKDFPDIGAVLLTSPDYFGFCADLKGVSEAVHNAGKILIVDNAHGSHLKFFSDGFYPSGYADLWIDGVHKTLPALTQCSVVNVCNGALAAAVEESLNIFRTTSPSYILMSAAEYGVKYADKMRSSVKKRLVLAIERLKYNLAGTGASVLENDDIFKVVLSFENLGCSAKAVETALKNNNVFCELCNERYLLIALSVLTEYNELNRLESALREIAAKPPKIKGGMRGAEELSFGARAIPYLTAVNSDAVYLDCGEAAGKICARNVGFFPPCYPAVAAGELISEQMARELCSGAATFGLKESKIPVCNGEICTENS